MIPEDGERRSGEDRRMTEETKTCAVPCAPISEKLDGMVKSKLFYWIMGGFAFFTVIVLGGAQWKIVDDLNEIGTDVKVMSVTVSANATSLNQQVVKADRRYEGLERRVDSIEKGETFFNFYNRGKHPE